MVGAEKEARKRKARHRIPNVHGGSRENKNEKLTEYFETRKKLKEAETGTKR